jgi:hypothetical protein
MEMAGDEVSFSYVDEWRFLRAADVTDVGRASGVEATSGWWVHWAGDFAFDYGFSASSSWVRHWNGFD